MPNNQQNPTNTLAKGTILKDYEIVGVLGTGGFGITYKAIHTTLNITRAIKEYMPSSYASRGSDSITVISHTANKEDGVYEWGKKRFSQEAKLLSEFNFPSIVKILDYFEANNTAYFVMEYYDGDTLEKFLQKENSREIPEDEIVSIIMPILEGLKIVHKSGYLHRDIAPDNIFLRDEQMPVLIDFGASRNAVGNKSQNMSAIIKAGYSPVEQYTANSSQNATADIYAISAVMYEMITKKRPPESNFRQLEMYDDKPDPIENIVEKYSTKYSKPFLETIQKGLEVRQKDRIQSIAEFQEKLIEESSKKEEEPTKASLKDLDDLILMAGSDKIITKNEEAMILKKAKNLGLDEEKTKVYIAEAIRAYGWNRKEEKKSVEKKKEDRLENYKILKTIEKEEIFISYKVKDDKFNYYTLKEYKLDYNNGEKAKKLLLDWLQKISKVKDSSFIEIKNVFVKHNKVSVLLPYFMDGHRLDKFEKKQLRQEEILAIINPILNVLEKLHSNNIFYGNIGSDDIYINSKQEKQGSSLFTNIVSEYKIYKILVDSIVVKNGYAPAEMYSEDSNPIASSDIYSISAIMYEMVTGKRPPNATDRQHDIFVGKQDSLIFLEKEYKDKYDKAFLQAITKGLSIKKENRQQSVKEFKEWLKNGDPEDEQNDDKIFIVFMVTLIAGILIMIFYMTSNN